MPCEDSQPLHPLLWLPKGLRCSSSKISFLTLKPEGPQRGLWGLPDTKKVKQRQEDGRPSRARRAAGGSPALPRWPPLSPAPRSLGSPARRAVSQRSPRPAHPSAAPHSLWMDRQTVEGQSLSPVRQLCFFFFFFFCRIFVPRPGIELGPLAVKAQSLNHWTAREFPGQLCF